MTVDTVLFDLGQVLVGWDPRRALSGALPPVELDLFLAGPFHEINGRLDRAHRWADLRPEVADPGHVALLDRYVERYAQSLTGPVPGTAELVRALRDGGVRLFGLTNWSAELFRHAAPAAPAIDLLEDVLVSGREGIGKPDPAIFRLAAERLTLDPRRTLFVDDSQANVDAAAALGFVVHRFGDAAGLRARLDGLGLPTRPADPTFTVDPA